METELFQQFIRFHPIKHPRSGVQVLCGTRQQLQLDKGHYEEEVLVDCNYE